MHIIKLCVIFTVIRTKMKCVLILFFLESLKYLCVCVWVNEYSCAGSLQFTCTVAAFYLKNSCNGRSWASTNSGAEAASGFPTWLQSSKALGCPLLLSQAILRKLNQRQSNGTQISSNRVNEMELIRIWANMLIY